MMYLTSCVLQFFQWLTLMDYRDIHYVKAVHSDMLALAEITMLASALFVFGRTFEVVFGRFVRCVRAHPVIASVFSLMCLLLYKTSVEEVTYQRCHCIGVTFAWCAVKAYVTTECSTLTAHRHHVFCITCTALIATMLTVGHAIFSRFFSGSPLAEVILKNYGSLFHAHMAHQKAALRRRGYDADADDE